MLPLLLAMLPSGDPRLDVRATLLQPRVTYAELGAWVQKASGVPVVVSPAIRERKATVLVENRSVRETMDRVAEALFLEWERTGDGYTMRLQPAVAAQEARALEDEDRLAAQELRDALDAAIRLSHEDDDALDARIAGLDAELDKLDKDETKAGQDRAAALKDEKAMAERVRGDGTFRRVARMLEGLSPTERDALLVGRRLYASSPNVSGTRSLPPGDGDEDDLGPRIVSLRVDPDAHALTVQSYLREAKIGFGSTISGFDTPTFDRRTADAPLAKRLTDWGTLDDATVLGTALGPGKPPAFHAEGGRTLADLLVSLHARTGLPIVADGLREAVSKEGLTKAKDVKGWIEALDVDPDTAGMDERASRGWLMVRRIYYWRQLAVEVPEGPIRALEGSRRGLDDYAAFAGRLTARQGAHLGATELVMDAPSDPLGSLPFLRLWNALDPASRNRSTGEGLSVGAMSAPSQDLYKACLEESLNNLWSENLPMRFPTGRPCPTRSASRFAWTRRCRCTTTSTARRRERWSPGRHPTWVPKPNSVLPARRWSRTRFRCDRSRR